MKQYRAERAIDGTLSLLAWETSQSSVEDALQPRRLLMRYRCGRNVDRAEERSCLARVLLHDCLGPDVPMGLCDRFERQVVRGLPSEGWELDEATLRSVIDICRRLQEPVRPARRQPLQARSPRLSRRWNNLRRFRSPPWRA